MVGGAASSSRNKPQEINARLSKAGMAAGGAKELETGVQSEWDCGGGGGRCWPLAGKQYAVCSSVVVSRRVEGLNVRCSLRS